MAMVAIIFPLLLQKPSPQSKPSDHVKFLEKRLALWKDGQLGTLISEGTAIQNRLSKAKNEV